MRHAKLMTAVAALVLLAGCSTTQNAVGAVTDSAGKAVEKIGDMMPKFTMTPKEHQAANRSKAWKQITRNSKVRSVSDERFHIEARGSLGRGIHKVEDIFITRAAAEAVRLGKDRFIITYLTYESQFPVSITNGFNSYPETVEIGTYEDFLRHSKEQRLLLSSPAMAFKRLDGVIVFVEEGDVRYQESFSARELYDNFIQSYVFS